MEKLTEKRGLAFKTNVVADEPNVGKPEIKRVELQYRWMWAMKNATLTWGGYPNRSELHY